MADISKQVSKGQKKQSQGVNLISTDDVNDYIQFKLLKYRYFKPTNDDIQKQYKEDFTDFIEATFKAYSLITIYNL